MGLGTGLRAGLGTGLGVGLGTGERTGLGTGLGVGLRTGLGTGLGVGLRTGLGTGLRAGLGVGLGVGDGRGDATGEGLGTGDRAGDGVGLGVGDGAGDALGLGTGAGEAPGVAALYQGVRPRPLRYLTLTQRMLYQLESMMPPVSPVHMRAIEREKLQLARMVSRPSNRYGVRACQPACKTMPHAGQAACKPHRAGRATSYMC